ncbi:Spo0E family sporulation regulatory protein-aspartic acid phosphatase [uncultured Metabacillus sp.]|uniref:Spo0E family sporulation regulatory protein-aspartic acid phosphatase n=1 Tax=uncultured Metabacillus sp. TaxID=2860135 RepID=UPI00260D850B|nr:Spo0E family sporulation regulatory protein-aspartic acid phosphatase [uncultured Metabacillus sp.]
MEINDLLLIEIEEMSTQLLNLYRECNENLLHPQLIHASQRLDQLMNTYRSITK